MDDGIEMCSQENYTTGVLGEKINIENILKIYAAGCNYLRKIRVDIFIRLCRIGT